MKKRLLAKFREIFYNVQFNKTSHKQHQTTLKKIYESRDLDEFSECFIECLKIPLSQSERHAHVDNMLEFAAKFAVSLYTKKDDEEEEQMCPFLMLLFNWLLENHDAIDQGTRFRICHFLNMLLNLLGDNATIDDSLCDKITSCMMERLLDRSPKVRSQAIFALQRLQDPTDENCSVMKMFIFHLSKDPNKDVRKSVLLCMGKNIKSLQAVLRRTRDMDEGVRKKAYVFISKVTVRSLTIKQREQLLTDGLRDRAKGVRETVTSVLLPSWLRHFDGEFMKLLRGLDAENATETAILAVDALLKRSELTELMKQLPVDPDNKLIPFEKLTNESVLYWCCLVQHLHRESCSEQIESCLPELTQFCEYIRAYLALMEAGNNELSDKVSEHFILYQLFEIVKTYDLADESGRNKLMELIIDTLLSDNCSIKTTESIVDYFEKVVPDVDARVNSLAHAISEIKMPTTHVPVQMLVGEEERMKFERAELQMRLYELNDEEYKMIQERNFQRAQELKEAMEEVEKKMNELSNRNKVTEVTQERNDAETMNRCLTITCRAAAAASVTTLTPTLRSLLDNLAIPNVDHNVNSVHILALKAVAILCRLEKEAAKKHITMYFYVLCLSENDRGSMIVSLQAVFDLLLHYGLEFFDIPHDDDDVADSSERRRSKTVRLYNTQQEDDATCVSQQAHMNPDGSVNFVRMLTCLLEHVEQEVRTLATEGICKLILHQRIKGAHLISRLVIQFFNPVTVEDLYLRQCLCNFFKMYGCVVPDSQEMIELAFMPTLRTLANAPDTSPLVTIDPCHMANFLISITSCRNHKPGHESYTVHNNLAETILLELLDSSTKIPGITLLKSLSYLDVKFDDNVRKTDLLAAADRIVESLSVSERRYAKYINIFKKKLASAEETQQDIQPSVFEPDVVDMDPESSNQSQ